MIAGAPTANANIAAQSHVIQSPQEQQAAYDAWLNSQLAKTQQEQSYYNQYNSTDQAYNEMVNALALSGGAPKDYISKNVAPGIAQGPGVTDSLNGQTIDRSALYWAHDQAALAREAARQGQAYSPPAPTPIAQPASVPWQPGMPVPGAEQYDPKTGKWGAPVAPSTTPTGWQNPGVISALGAYNNVAPNLPMVDTMGNYGANVAPGMATHQMDMMNFNALGPQIGKDLALGTQGVNSFNQNIQDQYSNKISNGQGYLDQIGGGFFGGVTPFAQNSSWANTSAPQWQAPSFANQSSLQGQAMQSPQGQAGAPFQQQAWAGGVLNPGQGFTPTPTNPFSSIGSGLDAQLQGQANWATENQQTQQPNWFNGTFNTNTTANPQLTTNAPWGSPYQTATPNNTAGAAPWFSSPSAPTPQLTTNPQQNPLTFGQSPWGSSWG